MLSKDYLKFSLPPLLKPENTINYVDFLSENSEYRYDNISEHTDDSNTNEPTTSSSLTKEIISNEIIPDDPPPNSTQLELSFTSNKMDEKFVLDPLSVIIKLAIISKKPKGSKICIYNNVVYIQEPNLFQPFIRYFYKNNKDDLHYLYNPIELACSLYLHPSSASLSDKDINLSIIEIQKGVYRTPNIRKLFEYAKQGLEYLMEHYKDSKIIIHTIIMYYNVISNYLSNNFNKNLFIRDTVSPFYNTEVLELLNSKWNQNKIKVVLDIFEYINKEKETIEENLYEDQKNIKCLDEFMINIDFENQKIISQYFKKKEY